MAHDLNSAKWVVDSSSLIDMLEHPNQEKVWDTFVVMIKNGLVVMPAEVWSEIEDNPALMELLRPYKEHVPKPDATIAYFQRVGEISLKYRGIAKKRRGKDRADPYIIAAAEQHGLTVVTEERAAKRPSRKISGVCEKRKIPCTAYLEMFRRQHPNDGW
jgi:predicted nucleic acid-binding protein